MPISKEGGRLRFTFNRVIAGRRIRASKLLPKGWTFKEADQYERKETARLYSSATGEDGQESTIEAAVLVYINEHCPTLKSGKAVEQQLFFIHDFYKGKLISELPEVAANITKKASGGDRTKQSHIAIIRAACRYAWKRHGMAAHDPAERLVLPKVKNERHMYATREEMLQIAKKCRPSTRPFIRIAFYSGLRLGEILRADIRNNCFTLKDTKPGTPRIVPIHPKLNSAIKFLPAKVAKSTIQEHFREARAKAGLEKYTFHDMRHSAASEMINAGVDIFTVGGVLGHKDPRSTKRYAHLNTASLEAAIKKIGGR